jgi:FHA domain
LVATADRTSDTAYVLAPGDSRQQLARILNAAYADGLLSENTLLHRLDVLFGSRLIDPRKLVGDLSRRARRPAPAARLLSMIRTRIHERLHPPPRPPMLLALDWSGAVQQELYVGRSYRCDVRLESSQVSRCHARLVFRDGAWVVQDLESLNGTAVNGKPVGRCRLEPGDDVAFADEHVRVD